MLVVRDDVVLGLNEVDDVVPVLVLVEPVVLVLVLALALVLLTVLFEVDERCYLYDCTSLRT